MRAGAFLYPWDVAADPRAADRIAEIGVAQVTLASAYHSTRALTPRHPGHRIVTARHSAVYYPPDEARWAGRRLRPHRQDWVPFEDAFGEAAERLAAAGVETHSWVILAHNGRLGAEHPGSTVVSAHGDRYPWALCVARPEVREYAATLAAEAAVRPGAAGTELESCGWYGLDHLHAHDKIGGAALGPVGGQLMSLCFCGVCRDGYAEHGADPMELRQAVARALVPFWTGRDRPEPPARDAEWAAVVELIGEELAAAAASWRTTVARAFQRETVAAVRAAAPAGFRVLLHAEPDWYRLGANVGVDPADVLAHADGVVVPATGDDAARSATLGPFVPHLGPDATLAANFQVVAGMGGRPQALAGDAAHAAALGATELRLYHAGLASDDDLAAVREALTKL
ncbi:hypothetical protein E1265_04525 [Streptomyces sp. 8K308]|uniref:hypothetical protein n=1 Tax=Streptomyces sp. 8K308 TaxID=2530388 RepID=UPI00104DC68B|nr:hypothetical protein [Streptomyces sp. 8K308]TDC26326.1 hypothetical protein E1265_04525 [Streptomyces sp. 8K308]